MQIKRAWSMPHKHTFRMKPVAELLERYVTDMGAGWIDPFCGHSLMAQFRNDLDPANAFALSHMSAVSWLETIKNQGPFVGCLFDPPYSPGQIARVYKSVGLPVGMKETQNASLYAECRDLIAEMIRPSGLVISCGWNSTGMGAKRGFEKIEMLLINHGGAHNDTIVLVEKKI